MTVTYAFGMVLSEVQDNIDKVRDKYPNLSANGLVKFDEASPMVPIEPVEFFECYKWLLINRHPKLSGCKARKTINTKASSYEWKHFIEKVSGKYISNGAFICAALHLGYDMKPTHQGSPNAYFNLKRPPKN